MIEEKFPKGAPGRKSFNYVPTEKKHFWRKEALDLRQVYKVMIPIHVFFFFVDIYVYHLEISIMVVDFLMAWLNFINYMTLNKITCIMEATFYLMTCLIAFTHIKRVLMEQEEWLPVFFYAAQFWIIYPAALFCGLKRLFYHWMKQDEVRRFKKKGNIIKKIEEAGHDRAIIDL